MCIQKFIDELDESSITYWLFVLIALLLMLFVSRGDFLMTENFSSVSNETGEFWKYISRFINDPV